METLTPEYAVLTDAASPTGTLDPDERAVALAGVDWDHLEGLARWHRLAPLLWRSLDDRSVVPAEVGARLEHAYFENAARNLYLRAELTRVLAVLETAAVPVVLLKGAALIENVYADPAVRIMEDLDILIPRADVERAQQAVISLGYAAGAAVHGEEGTPAWRSEHHYHSPPLVSPDRVVTVELHWDVVPPDDPAHFDISGFWARGRSGAHGPTHLLPAPEDLLAHVALHFSRNRLWRSDGSAAQAADVAWILACAPLDWDAVVERARSGGMAASLFLALFTAVELMGANVPAPVLAALRPSSFRASYGRRFLQGRVMRERSWFPLEFISRNRPPLMRALPSADWLREP